MDECTKAAVIGYWRSGATMEEIIVITGLFYLVVDRIIDDYKRKLKKPL